MTHRLLMSHLTLLMLGAFFLFANASLDAMPKHFHPKQLPNPNARAVLSVFAYDERGINEARKIVARGSK